MIAINQELVDAVGDAFNANDIDAVMAFFADDAVFDHAVGPEAHGIRFEGARYSRYRVWCLKQLREHFDALPVDIQVDAEALLKSTGCWEPLWCARDLPLLEGQEQGLPFRGDTKMIGVNETLLK